MQEFGKYFVPVDKEHQFRVEVKIGSEIGIGKEATVVAISTIGRIGVTDSTIFISTPSLENPVRSKLSAVRSLNSVSVFQLAKEAYENTLGKSLAHA